jgi:hypothetical protein
MTLENYDPPRSQLAGLCGSCCNARIVNARSGSCFYLCQLSARNPLLAKYPQIPVLRCAGYERQANAGATAQGDSKGG